jgi:hypothetical protein
MFPRTLRIFNYMVRKSKITSQPIAHALTVDASSAEAAKYIMEKNLKTAPRTDTHWRIREMVRSALTEQGVDLKKKGIAAASGLFSGLACLFFISFFI